MKIKNLGVVKESEMSPESVFKKEQRLNNYEYPNCRTQYDDL